MSSAVRNALWAIAVGVLSLVVAASLFRATGGPMPFFLGLLVLCAGLVSAGAAMLAEISPGVGAAGGALSAVLGATVLALAISAAPLARGARRPAMSDLLWSPLLVFLAVTALSAVSGWQGARIALRLSRRGGAGS